MCRNYRYYHEYSYEHPDKFMNNDSTIAYESIEVIHR